MRRANGHHGSCILLRRNFVANAYQGGALSAQDFNRAATDYLSFGNAYLERIRNGFGQLTGAVHIPGINMRVLSGGRGFRRLLSGGRYIDFAPDEIFHIKEYDEVQQIYGLPDWLGGMQSALLNQEATLFRRRYYVNGAHLGYILYTNDPKMSPGTKTALEQKFREGKGVGNFKSSYIHIPGGTEKAIQIIPIGDISQKDEFANVKSISANDVLTAHRVPPVLMGIVPQGTTSLGDPEKFEGVYKRTEVRAVCLNFMAINDELPPKLRLKFNFNEESPAKPEK
ncbi:hypothetical protein SDC9_158949 [bioreactor metagenome]|uniref:Phage portal protein n=1 Tax=bioreactor metagenome TaxID=1076179 RepID=A0A645FBA2_9ZZZZ